MANEIITLIYTIRKLKIIFKIRLKFTLLDVDAVSYFIYILVYENILNLKQ